jgi:hypothetical protein
MFAPFIVVHAKIYTHLLTIYIPVFWSQQCLSLDWSKRTSTDATSTDASPSPRS